jgi:hypothetical protein
MYAVMKRTTISLPDDLGRLIREEANRRGVSVSQVVRSCIEATLVGTGKRSLPFAGLCDDARVTPAADIEAQLEVTWARDLTGSRR